MCVCVCVSVRYFSCCGDSPPLWGQNESPRNVNNSFSGEDPNLKKNQIKVSLGLAEVRVRPVAIMVKIKSAANDFK